jgi:PKHD-type hydroxylase
MKTMEREWSFKKDFDIVGPTFSDDQCDEIVRLFDRLSPEKIAINFGETEKYRDTDIGWIFRNSRDHDWIFDRLIDVVSGYNKDVFQFEIDAISDLQLGRYRPPGQLYNWHTDLGAGAYSRRKLSVSVMLNKAEAYVGGDLQFGSELCPTIRPQKGNAVIFPSWVVHRVTPVTAGERWSLVTWFLGPPFR